MRVTGTTLAVCALLGGVATATEAEAARTRQDIRQTSGHVAKVAPSAQSHKSSLKHATRHRTGRHATVRRGRSYATVSG